MENNTLAAIIEITDKISGNLLIDVIDSIYKNGNTDSKRAAVAIIKSGYEPDNVDFDGYHWTIDGDDYQIYTDSEADEALTDYIGGSVWAFNSDFLSEQTGIDSEVFTLLQGKCEDSNLAILKLIEGSCGLSDFIENAVSTDGRGSFLSSYDGEEIEFNGWFFYRI